MRINWISVNLTILYPCYCCFFSNHSRFFTQIKLSKIDYVYIWENISLDGQIKWIRTTSTVNISFVWRLDIKFHHYLDNLLEMKLIDIDVALLISETGIPCGDFEEIRCRNYNNSILSNHIAARCSCNVHINDVI